jgi:hypothetical protein
MYYYKFDLVFLSGNCINSFVREEKVMNFYYTKHCEDKSRNFYEGNLRLNNRKM